MTPARALFVKLMDAYAALEYGRTLLEVQKLAYFLQEAGEPLRLKYEAGHYGPYAANLNKVLEVMEGHFIRGYGDSQKPNAEIELLPGAVEEATSFLAGKSESLARLERVALLMEGFETPYGMELLATTHWVAHRGGPTSDVPAFDAGQAIEQIPAGLLESSRCSSRSTSARHGINLLNSGGCLNPPLSDLARTPRKAHVDRASPMGGGRMRGQKRASRFLDLIGNFVANPLDFLSSPAGAATRGTRTTRPTGARRTGRVPSCIQR